MEPVIATAEPADLEPVKRLLEESGLPSRDIDAPMLRHFLVSRQGTALAGVIGLEPLGDVGLLRSAAVAPGERGRGLGIALTRAVERRARELGMRRLYLLTTTAEAFFGKLGYRTIPRAEAPAAIQGTTEYRELCASTSVCMLAELRDLGTKEP